MSLTAFAQTPNQTCQGINDDGVKVEANLYLGKKIDKEFSQAKIIMIWDENVLVETGTITNQTDLMGVRMFKNKADSLRFLTSGLLHYLDNSSLQLTMKCSKFKR